VRTRSFLTLICGALMGCSGATRSPNILLLVVDSLRSDHLGLAGYDRPTSQTLDSLAMRGVAFSSSAAQAPWTEPSVASLLTGRYPSSAFHKSFTAVPGRGERVPAVALGEGVLALPAMLSARGYVSAAFSASGMVNHQILGLQAEFAHFDAGVQCTRGDCAARINARVLEWLSNGDSRPWFCYVHYMDVHHPYEAPSEYVTRFRRGSAELPRTDHVWMKRVRQEGLSAQELTHLVDMYDAEIAYLDDQIGHLLNELSRRGMGDELLVVVCSDHGDEFNEHGGVSHGHTLYEELTRCPLVFVWPNRVPARGVLDCWVANVDIVPTVLDLVDIAPPRGLGGATLVPYFRGDCEGHPAYSEMKGSAVRRGRWKLWEPPDGMPVLFDLEADPTEQRDLAKAEPDTMRSLHVLLSAWRRGLVPPRMRPPADAVPILDSATVDMMRTLGYIE
jgi:arylsulfatase A-like enzyme